MTRTLVTLGTKNYFVFSDGRVVEERIRHRWKRFRPDQWPPEYVSDQQEVPVEDPELIERVRAEFVRKQHLGVTLEKPRQLSAKTNG